MVSQDHGIHSFKEVINFSRFWEEEEAQLIRREEKMGAIEEQALTIERRSLKRWGIWRTWFLKNLLSILRAWIRNDEVMNEEDDEAKGSSERIKKESTHETNKDKYFIIISSYCFAFVYIQLMYYAWYNVCINDSILLIYMCYQPKWHFSIRVTTFPMLVDKRAF